MFDTKTKTRPCKSIKVRTPRAKDLIDNRDDDDDNEGASDREEEEEDARLDIAMKALPLGKRRPRTVLET